MLKLRDISFRRKLTLIIMLTSGSALLLACGAVVTLDLVSLRQNMERDIATQATVLGDNSTAALSFRDADGAAEVLSVLQAQPRIVTAYLFTPNGKVFAAYRRADAEQVANPDVPGIEGSHFTGNRLVHFQRITLGSEVV